MAKECAYIYPAALTSTADAIRSKLGTTVTYTVSQFGDAINSIQAGITPEIPTISVSTGGLITASANGQSATQQLSVQAATSITPTESQQTVVAAGKYTTGAITVNAIPNNYIGTGVTINKYYTGSTTPSSSLGRNGDLYLVIPASSDEVEEENPIAP